MSISMSMSMPSVAMLADVGLGGVAVSAYVGGDSGRIGATLLSQFIQWSEREENVSVAALNKTCSRMQRGEVAVRSTAVRQVVVSRVKREEREAEDVT